MSDSTFRWDLSGKVISAAAALDDLGRAWERDVLLQARLAFSTLQEHAVEVQDQVTIASWDQGRVSLTIERPAESR